MPASVGGSVGWPGSRSCGPRLDVGRRQQRRGRNRRHLAAQRRHIAFAVGVDTIRQEDDVARRARVEPQRRAGEAGVAERPNREQLATIRGVRRVDVPPQASDGAHRRRRGRRGHPRDRGGRQNPRAAKTAAAEQHPAEPRQVGRRAEQTGMPRHPVHPSRRRVVDDAAKERNLGGAARPAERRAPFSRRDPRSPGFRWEKRRVLHAKRIEHLRLRVAVEPLAAHAADDVAKQEEVDVAVHELLAGRGRRHFFDGAADRFVRAVKLDLELEVRP